MDIKWVIQKEKTAQDLPREGIAVYLVLDQSSSMAESTGDSHTKIDLVKNASTEFVQRNHRDLIGIVEFARTARTVMPLTFETASLNKALSQFRPVESEDQNGTAIGYAIFKTANLLSATRYFIESLPAQGHAPYNIKNSAIVLITDGFQSIHPLDKENPLRSIDIEEAADYAKNNGIHLYIINVEPQFLSSEYTPHRNLLERAVSKTGGKIYFFHEGSNLTEILESIHELESGVLIAPQLHVSTVKFSTAPYFICLGLLLLALAFFLKTVIVRIAP